MCSYCGCESVECIGRFMAEHSDLVNVSGELRRGCATRDHGAVVDAADRLAGLLSPHTHAEEVGIFAVLREDDEFTDHVDRLCAEHDNIDALLAQVRAGSYETYPAFEELLRAHIDHEDNGLFPAAAIALAGPEWERVMALTPPAPA